LLNDDASSWALQNEPSAGALVSAPRSLWLHFCLAAAALAVACAVRHLDLPTQPAGSHGVQASERSR
jgi:hypothetical protein